MNYILRRRELIANYVGCSWPTVKRLIEQDGLPAVKLGKCWQASTEELDKWKSTYFEPKTKATNLRGSEDDKHDVIRNVTEDNSSPSHFLVGKFFHSFSKDRCVKWQGRVVGDGPSGTIVVETYDWFLGETCCLKIAKLEDALSWDFYYSEESMRKRYDEVLRFRTEATVQEKMSFSDIRPQPGAPS